MNRFMAGWIRKVVNNHFDASMLYYLFFRKSVERHFDNRETNWRKNTKERKSNG